MTQADSGLLCTAAHEAGHAVAAWLLGRHVLYVSIEDQAGSTGPCSVDRAPQEPLNGKRRPAPAWHGMADEVLIVLAGALSEDLTEDVETPSPLRPGARRVASDPPPLRAVPETPVTWQPLDAPPEWPQTPFSDRDQVELLIGAITDSDAEAEALTVALRLRAEAMVRHPHFRHLHRHLTAALMRDRELHASDVRRELQRAELRYITNTATTSGSEDEDDGEKAA